MPAVSLALSQRTTKNLDEASIKAKHPQTSKYNPTFEVLCNDYSALVNFRKQTVMLEEEYVPDQICQGIVIFVEHSYLSPNSVPFILFFQAWWTVVLLNTNKKKIKQIFNAQQPLMKLETSWYLRVPAVMQNINVKKKSVVLACYSFDQYLISGRTQRRSQETKFYQSIVAFQISVLAHMLANNWHEIGARKSQKYVWGL